MTDINSQSLGQLEDQYKRRLAQWKTQRSGHLQKIAECDQQIDACETKLNHIQALRGGPAVTPAKAAPPSRATVRKPAAKKAKRRRKSPVREATLKVLRHRPGQRLSVAQIRTLIRKDTSKRVSRQSINVNLDILEQAKLVRRYPAPRGAGARFVFEAAR